MDGGSIIDNQGFSAGDRTFEIVAEVDETMEDLLWSNFQGETFMILSCRDGVFYGAIDSMEIDRGQLNMKFLAQEQDNNG